MQIGRLLATNDERWDVVALRVTLAVVMFPHGAQKALGWFGGYGFSGTQGYFVETLGMPWLLGAMVILIEFLGSVFLLVGLGTRVVAAAVAAVMVGAVLMGGHLQHGFFMNWFGNQAGEGFEFHLLVLGMAGALMIAGGGAVSADARFAAQAGRPRG